MPNSFTANLNLEKPEVGADSDLWGGHLNSDLDILDSIFTSATTRPQSTIIKSDTKWVDATTTTRAVLLSLTSISNATTRTWTAQNTSGTVAFTSNIATATTAMATTGNVAAATATTLLMDLSSVQTATNKTLTAPLLTGILAASTGATAGQATTTTTRLATVGYVDRVAVQQYVITTETAEEDHATTMAYDDNTPQNTDGSEYLTVSITPKSATSKLLINVEFNCTITDVSQFAVVALFQDSTAGALKAVGAGFVSSGGQVSMETISFAYEMTSGTTSATTFKVRAGTGAGTQLTMNGRAGTRLFGGSCISFISVTELGI